MHFTDICVSLLKLGQGDVGTMFRKLKPDVQLGVLREVCRVAEERVRAEALKLRGGG